jgi:hypothetical protein
MASQINPSASLIRPLVGRLSVGPQITNGFQTFEDEDHFSNMKNAVF